ncbi:hypothetical protein J2Z32_002751 [Paenibacillus turicensis]|uniref:Uncharacterized protein n=1 Tax=Paenibacillus turicensis TaxID=160487 RepID=A0ABS4FU64_9BACL|nr:hypothetical protein [Paenibacillus turicensis]
MLSTNQCSFDSNKYTHTSAAQALFRMIGYTDKKEISLIDVMGYTSWAFRINIHARTVDIGGPYASLNWGKVFIQGMKNLGFMCESMGEPNFMSPSPEELQQALIFVQSNIDRGIPVMAWDLFVPEFGVIYGYDDKKQLLNCKDTAQDGLLPYAKLGRGRIGELFMMGITDSFEVDEVTAFHGALELVLDHAFRHMPRHDDEPYHNGLAAYDAWIQAFQSQSIEVVGNAYNALVVSDAREFAYKFLTSLAQKWSCASPIQVKVSQFIQEAAKHYYEVACNLVKVRTLFPFPQGGAPNAPDNAHTAIELLRNAQKAEKLGIGQLQMIFDILEQSLSR